MIYTVTDEDINTELEAMRNKNARIVSKEDAIVENGSITVMILKALLMRLPLKVEKEKIMNLQLVQDHLYLALKIN